MGSITLNKPSGGQLTLSPEDGATNETVTIPSVGVGKVLQVVKVGDNAQTNVTTSGGWVTLATGSKTITALGSNSSYAYSVTFSYESDQTSSFNMFMQIQYRVNSGTWQYPSDAVVNLSSILNSMGTGSITYNYLATPSTSLGDSIEFRVRYYQSIAASIFFNQQSLGGQPSGTNNYSSGFIMEVAQ